MDTYTFIDRRLELEAFTELLAEGVKPNILFLRGIGGMGKSSLLRIFANICRERRIPYTIFTFRSIPSNPLEVILKLSQDLGWKEFDRLRDELIKAKMFIPELADKDITADPNVLYAFSGYNVEGRLAHLASITSAFLTDIKEILQKTKPVVCLFDDVEIAGPVTRDWLFGQFLGGVTATPGAIIVIAGRQIPQPARGLEEYCRFQDLGGIEDHYWYQYAKLASHLTSPEVVEELNTIFKGRPLDMAIALSALAKTKGDQE